MELLKYWFLLVRDDVHEYADYQVFKAPRGAEQKIDVWILRDELPAEVPAKINVSFELARQPADGGIVYALRKRKLGTTRREYSGDDMVQDGRKVITGVYVPAASVANPPPDRLFMTVKRLVE